MIEITNLLEMDKDVLENGTVEGKRNFLARLGSNLVWNDEILNIYSLKSINKFVEGINGIKSKFPEFEPKNYQVPQGLKEKTDAFSPVFSMLLQTWEDVRMSILGK